MEGAAYRRVMAIAATVLRASLERAARLVSHLQVKAERRDLKVTAGSDRCCITVGNRERHIGRTFTRSTLLCN